MTAHRKRYSSRSETTREWRDLTVKSLWRIHSFIVTELLCPPKTSYLTNNRRLANNRRRENIFCVEPRTIYAVGLLPYCTYWTGRRYRPGETDYPRTRTDESRMPPATLFRCYSYYEWQNKGWVSVDMSIMVGYHALSWQRTVSRAGSEAAYGW